MNSNKETSTASKKALRFLVLAVFGVPCVSFSQSFQFELQEPQVSQSIELQPEPLPQSMGSLGDSLSAAAIAGFKRQNFILPWEPLLLLVKAMKYGFSKDIGSFENRGMSWAAGMGEDLKVWSHGRRIAGLAGKRSIPIYNAAVSGAESLGMYEEQLPKLQKWSRNTLGQEFPDYVTILVGSNDVCADSVEEMKTTEEFFVNLERTVDDILDQSPTTKILISSLPNIENLRSIAKDANVLPKFSCEKMWKKTGMCPTLTSLSDPETRRMVAERVRQLNEAMDHLVQTRAAIFGDRLRYVDKVYSYRFTPNDLSVDCFHPNYVGQDKMAEMSFKDSWWSAEWDARAPKIRKEWQEFKKKRDKCRARYLGERNPPAACREYLQ